MRIEILGAEERNVRRYAQQKKLRMAQKENGVDLTEVVDGVTYKFCFKHNRMENIANFKEDARTSTGYATRCFSSAKGNNSYKSTYAIKNNRVTTNPLDGLSQKEIERRRDKFLRSR